MKLSIEDKLNDNDNCDPHLRLRISVSSHQGGRKYMEDEYAIVHYQSPSLSVNNGHELSDSMVLQKSFVFLGIFDGHGGDMAARYTRQNLCRNIVRQRNFWSDNDDKVCLAIHKGFVRTQKDMMKEVGKWPKTSLGLPSTSGTTASVLFIMNGKYYTGHVGDSRIVLGRKVKCSNRWAACPMTRDHKPESPRERKRIEAAGGQVMSKSGIGRVVWNRPRSNILSDSTSEISYDLIPFLSVARSLGDLWSLNKRLNKFVVSPEPDVKSIPIDSSDKCLILASDGLWNMINLKHAIKVIQDFEEEDCYDSSDESFHSGFTMEPDHSHSLELLNVCLNRWVSTRFRADNTTVLVVMLDRFHDQQNQNGQINHSNDNIGVDHYDFDLNGNTNDFNETCMIGDTIHSYDFDKQQTDENFLDVKTHDEEEVELLLNELLDHMICMNTSTSLKEKSSILSTTTSTYIPENELIDEDQLSLINFSTLSSQTTTLPSHQQQANNCRRSNFNCSFNIFDHRREQQLSNDKTSTSNHVNEEDKQSFSLLSLSTTTNLVDNTKPMISDSSSSTKHLISSPPSYSYSSLSSEYSIVQNFSKYIVSNNKLFHHNNGDNNGYRYDDDETNIPKIHESITSFQPLQYSNHSYILQHYPQQYYSNNYIPHGQNALNVFTNHDHIPDDEEKKQDADTNGSVEKKEINKKRKSDIMMTSNYSSGNCLFKRQCRR